MIRDRFSKWRSARLLVAGALAAIACAGHPGVSGASPPVLPNSCYAGIPSGFGSYEFSAGGNACSAPTPTGSNERWDTTAYIGLSFSIGGDGFKPHLTGGVRETNVNSSNTVFGAEANVSVSLADWLNDTQIRLLALAGNTDVLGNAGVGWDVGKHSFLLNAGGQIPYVRAFVDYTIDTKALRAFLEVNSYAKIDAVQHGIGCGAGTVLATAPQILSSWANAEGATDVVGDIFAGSMFTFFTQTFAGSPSANFVNGQTCYAQGTPPVPT